MTDHTDESEASHLEDDISSALTNQGILDIAYADLMSRLYSAPMFFMWWQLTDKIIPKFHQDFKINQGVGVIHKEQSVRVPMRACQLHAGLRAASWTRVLGSRCDYHHVRR